MKIAVIGAGIFGCTAAIHLKREGHEVDLYEAKDSILRCASTCNQYRLHRGYHYPRSPETIAECKQSLQSFEKEFPEAVVHTGKHLYAIAREGSKVTPGEYLNALDKAGLEYTVGSSSLVDRDNTELVIEAEEPWLDLAVLRGLMWDNLRGVNVRLNTGAWNVRDSYDKIIVAVYAQTNGVLQSLGCGPEEFQYEVVEKPVLKMPDEFQNVGIVVMDGPFCSLDPMCHTPYHVMGHVKHSIHHTSVGTEPLVPEAVRGFLDRGVIYNYDPYESSYIITNAGADFIPAMFDCEYAYIGSMFTVRAVLPNKDDTDERPTLVNEMDDQVIRIFSGKIPTAVEAAKEVCELVSGEQRLAA